VNGGGASDEFFDLTGTASIPAFWPAMAMTRMTQSEQMAGVMFRLVQFYQQP
jgi:hypothetical protein